MCIRDRADHANARILQFRTNQIGKVAAYLLRDPTKKADVWSDLQQVMKQLGKQLPKRG